MTNTFLRSTLGWVTAQMRRRNRQQQQSKAEDTEREKRADLVLMRIFKPSCAVLMSYSSCKDAKEKKVCFKLLLFCAF